MPDRRAPAARDEGQRELADLRDAGLQGCGDRGYSPPARSGLSPGAEGMSRGVATDGPRQRSVARVALSKLGRDGEGMVPARAANGAKTMAASKFPSGDSPHKRGPLPARPAVARPEPSSPALQEKVLAEISHELGNFFHKLYYWSDFLQDGRARRSPDATATQMLERTIRNF